MSIYQLFFMHDSYCANTVYTAMPENTDIGNSKNTDTFVE